MTITSGLVNELRGKTGAGMLDCKKALVETNGNIQEAIDLLRKKGIASAAKKSDRGGKEGSVALMVKGDKAVMLEINCETDFVAKNEQFQAIVQKVLSLAFVSNAQNIVEFLDTKINGQTVTEFILENTAIMGENLSLSKFFVLNGANVFSYVHNAYSKNSGKIAVLVQFDSNLPDEKLRVLGEQIAMQIAAAKPVALAIADIDEKIIAREKNIFIEQARESGKPDVVIEKMIEGRMRKFYEEVVLSEQLSIFDNKTKIKDLVAEQAKALGGNASIKSYRKFELGQEDLI
jgi:elongation factor Ts